MTLISCVDCGATIAGAKQRRRCDPCRVAWSTRRTVRTLARGEKIPSHKPSRYLRANGYVLLRWRIGTRQYVETYEHRVFDGRIVTHDEVHHCDRNKSNNDPSNLLPLSAAQHHLMHSDPTWWLEARSLYERGLSAGQIGKELGRNPGNVYRVLVKLDVPMRKHLRIAIPYRERNRH